MKQRVVVLGAGGFIGRHVVAALAASDWATPVAAHHRHEAPFPADIEQVRVDASSEAELARTLHGAAAVVNCVAGSAATIVASARALFAVAAAMTPMPRVVHLSTMSVYGSVTGAVDEAAPLLCDVGPYSVAKGEAETLAAAYPNVVTLRPGIVYGPGGAQWSGDLGRLLLARRLGDLGAEGSGHCNLVHVGDVATAVMQALRAPGVAGEAFNLSTPLALSWNQYFARYAEALGVAPLPRLSRARLLLEKCAGPFLKVAGKLASAARLRAQHLPPALTPSLLALFRQDVRLKVDKAEARLSLRWTPVDEGLRDAAAWLLRTQQRGR